MRRRALTVLTVAALAAGAMALDTPGELVPVCTEHEAADTVVSSQADGTDIAITVFRPCGASAEHQAPVILHGHGWSGSRSTSGFDAELDAGFGVVSIDQRGHGESGGEANVMDPELEAQDVKSVIDHVAALDWVLHDRNADGTPIADDPVLFAMGGSYGGGYQTITALTELRESGHTRFNALAPEITWYDLPQSLAPNGVPRSEWNTVLYGAGVALAEVAPFVHEAFAWGASTGQWPDGTILGEPDPAGAVPNTDAIFHAHSPAAFVEQGIRIDVPVLWRQGISDTLFPLNEGLHNFTRTLTDDARQHSIFVGYNGGHVLPTVYPTLTDGSGRDACSFDGFGDLRLAFFQAVLDGADDPSAVLRAGHDGLARYNFTTDGGESCVRTDALPAGEAHAAGEDVVVVEDAWMSTTGPGAATYVELEGVTGPTTIAGIPLLEGQVSTPGVDQRMFFGLARGTSVADAQLIQNNLMPLRVTTPTTSIQEAFEIELPGISVDLAEGEKLFLVVTPFSEQFYGHGSNRTPGWMGFTDLAVTLPVVP